MTALLNVSKTSSKKQLNSQQPRSSRGFSLLNRKMSQQAVFFKKYDPMEELKISVDGSEIRIRVDDIGDRGITLSPDMAREAARILNLYAVIAEGADKQSETEA